MPVDQPRCVLAAGSPGYRLMPLREAIERSLADPRREAPADPESADPMGPMPQDPTWADGGAEQPLLAKAVDATRRVLDIVTPD